MLSGLLPRDGSDDDELNAKILAGRYAEIRMLFFLGKDLRRWIEQCLESSRFLPGAGNDLQAQSFARLLISDPPTVVREKLIRWGVTDYAAVFTRALGLSCLFAEPPGFVNLSGEFLRNYHRYADALFETYLQSEEHSVLSATFCRFELYASGEYSRKLESEWGTA